MREMGRLLVQLRIDSGDSDAKLQDFMDPARFRIVIRFESTDHTYTTPSLALKIGHSLRKCA